MRIRFVLLVAAALLAAAGPAFGQALDTIPPTGTKVRIVEPGAEPLHGRFWYLRSDTLHFVTEATGDPTAFVPLTLRQRVEMSRGRRRETWAAVWAVAGGAVGAFAASMAGGDDDSAQSVSHAVMGGAAGVLAGGVSGWLMAPEKWVRVTIPAGESPPPTATADSAQPR